MRRDGNWTRRGVLTATAAAGAATLVPTASGRTTIRGMIPEAEQFGGDYQGLFVHVSEAGDAELDASRARACDFGWNPDKLESYAGKLIDKQAQSHEEVPTKLYVAGDRDLKPGSLWVVEKQHSCPDAYVGLELEQVGAEIVRSKRQVDESGPGFGPLAALAGVGAGLYAKYRRDGRDE